MNIALYNLSCATLTLFIINVESDSIVSVLLVATVKDTITTGEEPLNMVQLVRSIDDQVPSFSQRLSMLTPERKLGCSAEQSCVLEMFLLLVFQNKPPEKSASHAII